MGNIYPRPVSGCIWIWIRCTTGYFSEGDGSFPEVMRHGEMHGETGVRAYKFWKLCPQPNPDPMDRAPDQGVRKAKPPSPEAESLLDLSGPKDGQNLHSCCSLRESVQHGNLQHVSSGQMFLRHVPQCFNVSVAWVFFVSSYFGAKITRSLYRSVCRSFSGWGESNDIWAHVAINYGQKRRCTKISKRVHFNAL